MAPDEVTTVTTTTVACDGGGGPMGHPMIYLTFKAAGETICCPYCSRRYRLAEGADAAHGH
jgi:uncharacterized Zn-finger protein